MAGLSELAAAAILGLVEGATEFIPVSSTGHLIIAGHWLGFTGERAKVFDVFIQLGAILAIMALYRRKLWHAATGVLRDPPATRLAVNLVVGSIPAALIGLLAHDFIKAHLYRPYTVAAALVVGGIAILVVERLHPRPTVHELDDVPLGAAIGVGLFQVLALFPGVSRSGATIMGGYVLGLSRPAATEFSFFLAIPIMLAAGLYDLAKGADVLTAADVPVFAVGFAVSFLSAIVVVQGFLRFVSRHSFATFAWYRIAVGTILLWWYGSTS